MADAILQLKSDPSLSLALGQNGREFVTCHYSRGKIAGRFELSLLECLKGDEGPKAREFESDPPIRF